MPFRNLPGVTTCRFKRGEYLIRAGEPIEYVYYLQKGTVYREVVSASGKGSILTSKAGGNIVRSLVGVLILYRQPDEGISHNDFVAHTNCLCYKIPKETCMRYFRQAPELMEELVRAAMEAYVELETLFYTKEEGQVAGRLCHLLLERAHETEDGLVVSRKVTNVEMAKFLAVHKVTVARILRVLKEQDCVFRTAQGLLLTNPEKLQRYASNELELKYR